jgi:2-aminoadipate transaminase
VPDVRIDLDRRGGQPIYLQIAATIRAAIERAELSPGVKLPSTRSLAQELRVHRQTIVEAYRLLEREGHVRAGVGAGTFVAAAEPLATRAELASEGAARGATAASFSWHQLLRDPRLLEEDPTQRFSALQFRVPRNAIQLSGVIPDRRQFPIADFVTSVEEVLSRADASLLDYGAPEGDELLRAWVVSWLARMGVTGIDESRVFIVSGSQQGLDLLARLLLAPGDVVATEAPTYTGAFMALRHAGARVVTVPMGPPGLSVGALETLLDREPVKFLYTMPCFQNPTGISIDAATRAQLLALARRRHLAIVEDHYDSDLHYAGKPPRPLLADDGSGQVTLLGTFSKMLFPGVRIGWLVAPHDLVESIRQARWVSDLASPTLTQSVMERFCRRGFLERHLERIRSVNALRLKAMLQALEAHFPPGATWTRPQGGMTLWVELPSAVNTLDLFRTAAERGVVFSPGSAFFPNGGGRHAMRLSFNRESEARIRRGIRLLGEMIAESLRTHRGEGGSPAAGAPLI